MKYLLFVSLLIGTSFQLVSAASYVKTTTFRHLGCSGETRTITYTGTLTLSQSIVSGIDSFSATGTVTPPSGPSIGCSTQNSLTTQLGVTGSCGAPVASSGFGLCTVSVPTGQSMSANASNTFYCVPTSLNCSNGNMGDTWEVVESSGGIGGEYYTISETITTAAQCNDGLNNDSQQGSDMADPQCHTDCNANNPGSYVANHNSESTPPNGSCPAAPTLQLNGRAAFLQVVKNFVAFITAKAFAGE